MMKFVNLIWILFLYLSGYSQNVVHSFACTDFPGITLKFVAGLKRLSNGKTVVTNWLGHNNFGKAPQAIEITPDKKVVWTYNNPDIIKTLSSIYLLDIKGLSFH
jgi:hypothetical protein